MSHIFYRFGSTSKRNDSNKLRSDERKCWRSYLRVGRERFDLIWPPPLIMTKNATPAQNLACRTSIYIYATHPNVTILIIKPDKTGKLIRVRAYQSNGVSCQSNSWSFKAPCSFDLWELINGSSFLVVNLNDIRKIAERVEQKKLHVHEEREKLNHSLQMENIKKQKICLHTYITYQPNRRVIEPAALKLIPHVVLRRPWRLVSIEAVRFCHVYSRYRWLQFLFCGFIYAIAAARIAFDAFIIISCRQ